jgi:tetratricopeptide (TPR) repeat protein
LSPPISIKLRCSSWAQLASIYKRDLARSAIFLRSSNPPPIGTAVRIDLTLPSESMVVLTGAISRHVQEQEAEAALAGRGAGVDVRLNPIPQSAMWLIETALSSAQKDRGAAARPAAKPAPARPAAPEREPALGDGADLAAAETELLVALTSELDSLRRLNPFQVLGLGYEAGDAEVRGAFGDLTRRYHPDRYARFQSTDLRHLAAEIFILVRDAYRRLGDEAGRAQARAQLQPKRPTPPLGTTPAPRPVPRAVPAKVAVQVPAPPPPLPPPPEPPAPPERGGGAGESKDGTQVAESMLDAGKYDEALAFFKILLRKNPNDRQAKAGVELAEGLRALAVRDRLEAAQRFEAALELDPANERAARELAEMRRLATNERKGMLSRLLGKKE